MEKVYHTAEEIGTLIGMSGKQVKRMAIAGVFPFYRPGKVYLFKKNDVLLVMEKYRIEYQFNTNLRKAI
jgi:excisionase family DNA binding protein